jgi:hypothetical protein
MTSNVHGLKKESGSNAGGIGLKKLCAEQSNVQSSTCLAIMEIRV